MAKAEAEKVSKKFEEAQKDLDKLADVVKDKYEVTRSEAEKMIEEIQKKIKK